MAGSARRSRRTPSATSTRSTASSATSSGGIAGSCRSSEEELPWTWASIVFRCTTRSPIVLKCFKEPLIIFFVVYLLMMSDNMNWKVVRNMSRSQDSNPSYSGKTPSLCHLPHHYWHLTLTWGTPHVPSSKRMLKNLKTWTTKHIKIVQSNTYLRNDQCLRWTI